MRGYRLGGELMPYLAIVYVADAHTANRIVERYSPGDAGRLVGLYAYPKNVALQCRGFCANKNAASPWRRSPRGFMVCGVCGGRHIHTRRRLIGALFDYLGVNRLPRVKTPGAFQNPKGWD